MNIKYIKIGSFVTLGIGLIGLTYLLTHIGIWQRTYDTFPVLNKTFLSGREAKMPRYIATSNAYALLQSGEYQGALALITGEDTMSYYNRGVIKTLTAYQQASGKASSGLAIATTLINDASRDFIIAQSLQTNKKMDKEIASNLMTVTELGIIINAKTCYVISTETMSDISGMQKQIQASQDLLKQEQQTLQSKKSIIPSDCFQRRGDTIQQSQSNLGNLSTILKDQTIGQQKILLEKRTNPTLCLQPQDTTLLTNFQKSRQKIEDFSTQHQQSLSLRQSGNADDIKQLCQAKNDSQLNQSIQNTIDQLLSSLQNQGSGSTQQSGFNSSTQPNYVPLDADEQKLLENIDKKNKVWIRQLERLKADPQYNGMNYIQTLFNEFYGNSGDFQ